MRVERGLLRATRSARRLRRGAAAHPLRWYRWLPNQQRYLMSGARRKIIRQGNQWGGKSTVALAEMIFRALGHHPFLVVHSPPVDLWVICASWQQSLAIQKKLWALVPKHQVHPDTVFDPIRGFRGRNPACQFKNGSIIRIKTTGQGGLNLSSDTIHGALFDEPPTSPRLYSEVDKRLLRTGGPLMMSLTPINAPTDWLKELCESGAIDDLHAPLLPENLIPVGSDRPIRLEDGTICDAEWIAQVREETLAHEVPVVVDGEWEFRVTGRVFVAFNETRHAHRAMPSGKVKLALGVDYGMKVGKQIALLVAVQGAPGDERVWVIDEAVGGEMTSVADDARAITEMLGRHNIPWKKLDHAWGDRLYLRGAADRKSNRELMRALAIRLALKSDDDLRPRIRTVKRGKGRGRGSVDAGCRFLHQAMLRRGAFQVHPRCARLIEALNRWDYTDSDEKDPIDALRYALQDYVFARRGRAHPTLRIA